MKKERKDGSRPQGMMAEIEIRDVWKEFVMKDGKLSALEGISIGVQKGEFLCIVGPSGCGKSTLLSIIAGLTRPERKRAGRRP
jgi:NitT/TauT family transport system ATP-binding protein